MVPARAPPHKRWRLALTVVGMGDTIGLGIAQQAHECVLREGQCLRASEALHCGEVTPASATWEGVYVDDHLAVQRMPRGCLACIRGGQECGACASRIRPWRDQEIVESSEDIFKGNS